jgi:hypothetical protein
LKSRAERPLTFAQLQLAIERAWSRETSDDPDEWCEENPSRGQCAVTALVVRDLLGGDVLIADVFREAIAVERHAWNRLASGIEIDLTRGQFCRGEVIASPRVQEPLLTSRAPERHRLLLSRVECHLADLGHGAPLTSARRGASPPRQETPR